MRKGVQACNFIKKKALTQVLSCEFCEISKNTSGRLFLLDDISQSNSYKKFLENNVRHQLWLFSGTKGSLSPITGFGIQRSSRPDVFCKKDVLRSFAKFSGKHLCQSSCEFFKISKNTFSYRTPQVAASENTLRHINIILLLIITYVVSLCKTEMIRCPFLYNTLTAFQTNTLTAFQTNSLLLVLSSLPCAFKQYGT